MFTNLLSSLFLALLSSQVLSVVNGADHAVTLSGLTYSPNHIDNVAAGDTITFTVSGGPHTVSQSTLANPCEYAPNGFDSEQLSSGKTYKITVNDTSPIWVFCSIPSHCRSGMVFAVNPGDQFAQFQQAATSGTSGSSSSSASASESTTESSESTSHAATSSTSSRPSGSSTSASTSTSSRPNAGYSSVGDVSASVAVGVVAALFGGLLAL